MTGPSEAITIPTPKNAAKYAMEMVTTKRRFIVTFLIDTFKNEFQVYLALLG
jgi:hypothetical protein